jgi:hypothetical protein
MVGLLSAAIALGGCSLPADEGVTPIDPDGLPPELADTTTTSTTTSTTTTVPASTSVPPETSAPTSPAPTTAPPSNAVPVDIYYADRADGMQPVRRLLLEPVSLQSVISQLEQPPDDLSSYGVTSALRPDLIDPSTSLDRSVLTLSLNKSVFDSMNDDQKRQAIAQMVLTFTSFAVPGEGNIGSVIIQVDGSPIPVFIPAEGTTRDPGPVFYNDFANLVVGTTTATTTTVPPATTAPPPETTAPPSGPSQ